jgi:hypothetical protein
MQSREFRVFAVLLVMLLAGTEALLAYNTLYTEGEVMQGLYWMLVWANLPILFLALWKPRAGTWSAFALGLLLLPWQASENRKWAQIHEEVVSMIRYVDNQKKTSGEFPKTLEGYDFQKPWIKEHVSYGTSEGSYRFSYFMDNPGTSYWFDSHSGFGYYPD